MKNLDLTTKNWDLGEKNRYHGPLGYKDLVPSQVDNPTQVATPPSHLPFPSL